MDNLEDMRYNSGINFTEVKDYMDTHIYYKENRYYQELFTYLTKSEYLDTYAKGIKVIEGKECYDSLSEAKHQAKLEKDTTGIRFVKVATCITRGTVLDLLSTEDIINIQKMYDSNQQSIDKSFSTMKGISKEDYVLELYCKKLGLGVIRRTKKVKSNQHVLKFINSREILTYKIVNCNVVDGIINYN